MRTTLESKAMRLDRQDMSIFNEFHTSIFQHIDGSGFVNSAIAHSFRLCIK